jgi:hypothetical protein
MGVEPNPSASKKDDVWCQCEVIKFVFVYSSLIYVIFVSAGLHWEWL